MRPAPHIEQYDVDPEARRDDWLALRRRDVTASDAGALLGVSPFKSYFELWMEKAGRKPEDTEETAAMLRGKMLEVPALKMLAVDRPHWRVWQPNVYLRDPAARMGATPDAYAVDPERNGFGVVQVKSVEPNAFRKSWMNESGESEPPAYVLAQTIQEAHLAGADWACVLALVIGNGIRLHIVEVPIDQRVIRNIQRHVAKFWKSIEDDNPPEPDYGRDGRLLAAIYADDNGREIDLSGDNFLPALLEEREAIKERMRADKARVDEIDAEIIAKLGDYERAFLPGWSIKRPLVRRKGFYVEPTEFRRLSIKKLD